MNENSSRSAQAVISNDDLFTEILVRLPAVLSLILFKSVSKHWYSLIKQAISLINNRDPEPPSGILISKFTSSETNEGYDFVPLDTRIPDNFTFCPKNYAQILDSCNGLLLCRTICSGKLYVWNPSISGMFNGLPEPNKVCSYYDRVYGGFKLVFDPTKSSHYKVIYVETLYDQYHVIGGPWVQIHTFSSETGNWSLCGNQFFRLSFYGFKFGVYWNDAIYWLMSGVIFKLDIMNEHPVLKELPTPDDKLGYATKLFQSRGCLLLFSPHYQPSRHCTIYEKRNVYSEWSVKYTVNLDDVAERCSHQRIFGIVLGEREEDSFLVWRFDGKVVKHKIVSKTFSTISDLGPNDDLFECFQFIPSFAHV